MMDDETYLGDGVYASFDGYQIWLHVDRAHGREGIALEPAVMQSLTEYQSTLRRKYNEQPA